MSLASFSCGEACDAARLLERGQWTHAPLDPAQASEAEGRGTRRPRPGRGPARRSAPLRQAARGCRSARRAATRVAHVCRGRSGPADLEELDPIRRARAAPAPASSRSRGYPGRVATPSRTCSQHLVRLAARRGSRELVRADEEDGVSPLAFGPAAVSTVYEGPSSSSSRRESSTAAGRRTPPRRDGSRVSASVPTTLVGRLADRRRPRAARGRSGGSPRRASDDVPVVGRVEGPAEQAGRHPRPRARTIVSSPIATLVAGALRAGRSEAPPRCSSREPASRSRPLTTEPAIGRGRSGTGRAAAAAGGRRGSPRAPRPPRCARRRGPAAAVSREERSAAAPRCPAPVAAEIAPRAHDPRIVDARTTAARPAGRSCSARRSAAARRGPAP